MFLMTNSINLIMIYLALELVSIPSYVLAGILKNDKKSNEASLKYVIFGSFASGLMLYGFSLLYGLSGTLNIYEIHTSLLLVDNPTAVLFSILLTIDDFKEKRIYSIDFIIHIVDLSRKNFLRPFNIG